VFIFINMFVEISWIWKSMTWNSFDHLFHDQFSPNIQHWLIVDSPIQLLRCEKSPYFASTAGEYMCFFRYSNFKAPHILLFSPSTKKAILCVTCDFTLFFLHIKAVTGFKTKLYTTLNLLAYQLSSSHGVLMYFQYIYVKYCIMFR